MNSSIEGLLAFIGRNIEVHIEVHIESHSESHIEGQIESHIESHIKSQMRVTLKVISRVILIVIRRFVWDVVLRAWIFIGAPQYQKLTKMYHFGKKRLV